MQDPDSGYYVYADLVEGRLAPTRLVVGQVDPASTGLSPYLNISPEQKNEIRKKILGETVKGMALPKDLSAMTPQQRAALRQAQDEQPVPQPVRPVGNAPTTGTLNNLVIFIRFSDETEFTDGTSFYTNMLNTSTAGVDSLRNYFREVSYNTLTIDSSLYPTPGSTVLSYQDNHPRSYYQPYNAVTNPGGYTIDRTSREHILLASAIEYVDALGQFPNGASIDGDGDGLVDSLTFIVSGGPDGWSELLWPHMWALYSFPITIDGKLVQGYSFQLNAWMNTGVLAHEMFHVLGSPDLYHYAFNGLQPVGSWDLMEANMTPPEHMGCYMKFKYGKWISSIPLLTAPGTYTLNPLTSSTNNCVKIASPYSAAEFFVLEYRNGAGSIFESSLPGTGLLVYRINTLTTGNAGGPPDEVYIYRPGGTTTVNGSVNSANYSSNTGRTAINDSTSPSSFLSDGGPGGLNICNVGAANATISFGICASAAISISGNAGDSDVILSYSDGTPKTATTNGSGDYTFVVSSGWSGEVTPGKAGSTFTPASRTYTNVTVSQTGQDYTSLVGPDDFGYTRNDKEPISWIDVSGGTNSGLTGDSWNNATGAIALPFSFKYYENSYTQLYISGSGYLSFTDVGFWPSQRSIPDPAEPNNVIAPHWAPSYIGAGGWVRYKSGGSAPNRYFVVEWHDLKGGDPTDTVGSDDTFRFEAILHENGDIVFQTQSMIYNGSWWSNTSGIEDSRGTDGLSYPGYQLPSNIAMRFVRPPAAARIYLDPQQLGGFSTIGGIKVFLFSITNTGGLGADTYDLDQTSNWPLTFYRQDGITPLTDSDSDGALDSGPIPQADTVTFTAKIATPGGAVLGSANTATVTARSSINTSKSKVVTLQTTIPASFGQVFMDDTNGAMSLVLNQPDGVAVKKTSPDWVYGSATVVTAAPNGNFVNVWQDRRCPANNCNEIWYAILDRVGKPLRAAGKLTDNSSVTVATYDGTPAVAAAPNGTIAVAWYRQLYNASNQFNYNIYFATLSSTGTLLSGPTKVTNNSAWVTLNYWNDPGFTGPNLAATDDNHFVLGWEAYDSTGNDIWYTVRNTSGASVFPVTALTSDKSSYAPIINNLKNGKVIVTWLNNAQDWNTAAYAVLNSSGFITLDAATLGVSMVNDTPDAVQRSDGKVALAWSDGDVIASAILNSAYALESGPTTALSNSGYGMSVTTDSNNRLIMTWMEQNSLMYALANSTGAFTTSPMLYMPRVGYSATNHNGQGTVPNPTNVLSIVRTNPGSTSSAASVNFTLTFSSAVTGVDTSAPFNDFSLTSSGLTGASVSAVSGSGKVYTVTVTTGSGNGTLRLNVVDNNSIVDIASNPLGGSIAGDGNYITGESYSIVKALTFTDVPFSYWDSSYIERLYNSGITSGCGVGTYCPETPVTRAQMAIFLLRGMHTSSFAPPAVGAGTGFFDVPVGYWADKWIKQLAAEGITSGCGVGLFCPDQTVTRAQMAVFLLRAGHGATYNPPAASGVFLDVPVGYWADKWIEQLALEGITSGCGAGIYCPDQTVTRAQMAVFLVKMFNLP